MKYFFIDFSSQDVRPKNVETINEMMEKGFQFFGDSNYMILTKDMDFGNRFLVQFFKVYIIILLVLE